MFQNAMILYMALLAVLIAIVIIVALVGLTRARKGSPVPEGPSDEARKAAAAQLTSQHSAEARTAEHIISADSSTTRIGE